MELNRKGNVRINRSGIVITYDALAKIVGVPKDALITDITVDEYEQVRVNYVYMASSDIAREVPDTHYIRPCDIFDIQSSAKLPDLFFRELKYNQVAIKVFDHDKLTQK